MTAASVESSERGFRADIQGLRAVAVLGVLAYHAGVTPLGGGFVGVDVFYVISGFLITGLLLRDADKSRRSQLGEFYARRVRRILPAAGVVIIATLVMTWLWRTQLQVVFAAKDARSTSLFWSNVRFSHSNDYFGDPAGASVFQQYWSLSVEEQFYAVWPLLFLGVVAVASPRLRRRALAMVVAAISVVSFALSVVWMSANVQHPQAPTKAFYLLPARAWELGVGVLLAVGAGALTRLGPAQRRALFAVGVLAIIAAMTLFDASTTFPGWTALLPVLGTAAVIAAGTGGTVGPEAAVLSNRPAQLVGRYSYSLYLWHWPVLLLLVPRLKITGTLGTVGVVFVVSTIAAVVTYHLVENPARHAAVLRASVPRSLALGAAIVLVCVGASTAMRMRAHSHLTSGPDAMAASGLVPTNYVPGNLAPALDSSVADLFEYRNCINRCVFAGTTDVTIEILGDSHAGHLGGPIEAAAAQLGATLIETNLPGCPWFAARDSRFVKAKKGCDAWREAELTKMHAAPPQLVIVSTRNDVAYRASAHEWSADVRAQLSRFPKTTKVVIIGDTPFGPPAPKCLSENLRDVRPCDRRHPSVLNAQLQALAAEAGAAFLDLRPWLCTTTRCPAITGNTLMWADGNHLTHTFAVTLTDRFVAALRPLL